MGEVRATKWHGLSQRCRNSISALQRKTVFGYLDVAPFFFSPGFHAILNLHFIRTACDMHWVCVHSVGWSCRAACGCFSNH